MGHEFTIGVGVNCYNSKDDPIVKTRLVRWGRTARFTTGREYQGCPMFFQKVVSRVKT